MTNFDIFAMFVGKSILTGLAVVMLGHLAFVLAKHWKLIARMTLIILYVPFLILKKGLILLGHSSLAH